MVIAAEATLPNVCSLQSASDATARLQGPGRPAGLPLPGSCHPRSPTNLSVCNLSASSLHACRALAVLLGLYSLAVVVAEATITPALPNMSVFSQTLRRVAHNPIACEMLCFLFLIYPCCAAYFAIYKLGRWSFYLLVPRCSAAAGGLRCVVWRAYCLSFCLGRCPRALWCQSTPYS